MGGAAGVGFMSPPVGSPGSTLTAPFTGSLGGVSESGRSLVSEARCFTTLCTYGCMLSM